MEVEAREMYIASNQIRCKKCGDTPFSAHRHDFKYCKCNAVAVDGGSSYLRRVGDVREGYEEMSISIDSEALMAIVNEVELAITSNRNSFGVVLAALRGIRDSGLSMHRNAKGGSVWEIPMTLDERLDKITELVSEKMATEYTIASTIASLKLKEDRAIVADTIIEHKMGNNRG